MNLQEMPMATLAEMRMDAKAKEDGAISWRRDIDSAIAARLKDRDEGTVSQQDGTYKIAVTYKVSRKVDTTRLQDRWEFIPDNVRNAFKFSAEVETKHFRALQELGGSDLMEVMQFITTKPASPSVSVEVKE